MANQMISSDAMITLVEYAGMIVVSIFLLSMNFRTMAVHKRTVLNSIAFVIIIMVWVKSINTGFLLIPVLFIAYNAYQIASRRLSK